MSVRNGIAVRLARLLGGAAIGALGLSAVLPQPTALAWQISLLASEWGHWFALVALLLLPGWRRSRMNALGSLLAAVGIVLLLAPLAQAIALNRRLPAALTEAFGNVQATPASADEPRRSPLVIRDLVLGVGSHDVLVDEHVYTVVEGQALALDLYRPRSAERPLPVVITVHGGSWQSGSRRSFADLSRYLAARHHVVAAIDYRLAPRWRFPAAQEDVAAAVAYVKGLAETVGLDPNRIALLGRSAGGQIALLAAYTANDPAIRGVVSFYGPAALRWGYENPARKAVIDSSAILEAYLGGSPATHGPQYDAAEPARYVDASTPPTLFIHGLRDELVSPFHAEFVSARLIEAGVAHFILRLPWAVHGCDYLFSGPCGQISTYAVERFLRAVMNPRGSSR